MDLTTLTNEELAIEVSKEIKRRRCLGIVAVIPTDVTVPAAFSTCYPIEWNDLMDRPLWYQLFFFGIILRYTKEISRMNVGEDEMFRELEERVKGMVQ